MKILMYAPVFPPMIGGPATQSENLCRALVGRGHVPVVVTVGDRFSKKDESGYLVYRYPWAYTSTPLDKLVRWIIVPIVLIRVFIREKPEVLHCHSVSALSFVAGLIARITRRPSLIKFAGDWVWETYATSKVRSKDFEGIYSRSVAARFLTFVQRTGLSLFDVVWVPSQFRAQNVRRILGENAPVRIIPNALLLTGGGVHAAPERPIVVSANRFIPHKRIPTIIEAFAKTGRSDATLVLVGAGQERILGEAKQTAERLGVAERVIFTGKLSSDEVYNHFKRATLYVSASLEEGFPNVFIEAMHFGLPIVSTDVGGCRELVVEGETGYLVDTEGDDQLTRRMKEILSNSALRDEMAHAAYERSKQFNLAHVVDSFIDLYEELVRRRR